MTNGNKLNHIALQARDSFAGMRPQVASYQKPRAVPQNIYNRLIVPICLLSGLAILFHGALLFLGDILMPIAVVVLLWNAGNIPIIRNNILKCSLPLLFALYAVAIDSLDDNTSDLLIKGLARNASFGFAFMVGVIVCILWGYARHLAAWIFAGASLAFGNLIICSLTGGDYYLFFRTSGLAGFGMLILLLIPDVRGRLLIRSLGSIILGLLFLYYYDVRFGSTIFIVSGIASLIFLLKRGQVTLLYTIALLLLLGSLSFAWISNQKHFDFTAAERHDSSTIDRLSMASQTLEGIYASPFTGYGTWSNPYAMQLTDTFQDEQSVTGVHNMILQLTYEYGIMGFIFVTVLVIVSVFGIARFIQSSTLSNRNAKANYPLIVNLWMSIMVGTQFGPFANFQRISWGLGFGGLVALFIVYGQKSKANTIKPIMKQGYHSTVKY